MDFLFDPQSKKKKKAVKPEEYSFLSSLPYIVKHSLFLENEMMSKMRELSDIG